MSDTLTKDGAGILREPDFELLDPQRIRLFRDGSGRMRLTIEGERSYLDVKAVRAFPLSEPWRYIGFLDAKGKDKAIGLVVDIDNLDAESKRTMADALDRHYFTPTIMSIRSLKEEFGAVYCDVETDRGRRRFMSRGIRDAMEELEGGELLIPDVGGNRYRIADWRRLDVRSRRLLESVV